ncbi:MULTISPECIES: sigma-70 family RNA polymerase sigma factor [unclassified Bacillus (in: firmicutes)]|uniref:sigma-70 family RNA polymerase sigma factor n=1 Tax=unclassified Bacillus (in: firmicutes) TaxID=185979 RepID=UPI0008E8D1A3|nr:MULTISPECIES: sigma-70 family RNA polymerase sigma factor [unclassified Bacillus (in: firmicutes)]SFA71201.1 RNA polymerase, sigma subunit, SigV [Bacillus sp. UNCCL13]SFQ61352.1 RNA polymerase, sigma subunit, SigV [Bacillus sp. cl95]
MTNIHTVKKAINGDEVAFETLIKDESAKLYRTAFLYMRNKEDALDVLQDTVTKAFVSIHQLKSPEFFSTWLIKILIRTAYHLLEKKKKFVLTGDDLLNQMVDIQSKKSESEIDLSVALAQLEMHYQTVIILFYYHDLSIRKIAETLGKPEGTIKTYLRRAKLEMRKVLEGKENYEQRMV